MHQQNACLYLAETTWLFTQLWASLQSGEADGGVVSHMSLGISKFISKKFRDQPMGRQVCLTVPKNPSSKTT